MEDINMKKLRMNESLIFDLKFAFILMVLITINVLAMIVFAYLGLYQKFI
jgi:hypothetical protein